MHVPKRVPNDQPTNDFLTKMSLSEALPGVVGNKGNLKTTFRVEGNKSHLKSR